MTLTQRWTTTVAWTMILTAGADNLGVNTALRAIQATGVASAPTLVWALLVHLLALLAALSAGERISTRIGNRRVLIAGCLLYAAASAACALAMHGTVLIVARAAQGAGSGLAVASALGLMSLAFPADTRGRAAHRVAPGFALALAAGPLVDGAVAAGPGWRWIFAADAVIGVGVAVIARRLIGPDAGRRGRLDPEGPLAAVLAVGGPVWALIRAERVGWDSPQVYGPLLAAVVALAAVLWWDTPSGSLHRWTFLAANASDLLLFASVYGTVYLVAAELRGAGGLGPLGIGLRLTAWTAVTAAAMLCAAHRGFRSPWVSALGCALHAGSLVWLASLAPSGRLTATAAAPLVLSGVGAGLALSRARVAGLGRVRRDQPGRASALLGPVPIAGAALGVALLAMVAHAGRADVPTPNRALPAALVWAAALAGIATLATLAVPRERRSAPHPPALRGPAWPVQEPAVAVTGPNGDRRAASKRRCDVPR